MDLLEPRLLLSSAAFLNYDLTTKGDWKTSYGADGVVIPNDADSHAPAYASVGFSGQGNYTWQDGATDVRAPLHINGSTRLASCWYASSSFDIDINFTDGQQHAVAIYGFDWDHTARGETVSMVDADTGQTLDSRSLSGTNFDNGEYATWLLSGHVRVHVTRVDGPNAGPSWPRRRPVG